jgi:DNA-binding transcriptional ArsR family regulator
VARGEAVKAAGNCALPTEGLNACPPSALSCFTCEHYRTNAAPEPVQLGLELRTERAAHVRARIFDALAAPGVGARGLTFEEVAHRADLNPNTVRGRLSELEREGVVRRRKDKRRTSNGGRAALYVVAPERPAAVVKVKGMDVRFSLASLEVEGSPEVVGEALGLVGAVLGKVLP